MMILLIADVLVPVQSDQTILPDSKVEVEEQHHSHGKVNEDCADGRSVRVRVFEKCEPDCEHQEACAEEHDFRNQELAQHPED